LFTKRDFSAGEVIFEETPLVLCQFAWNEDCNYKSCELCLRPLETAQENARRLSGNSSLILPFPELDLIRPSEHRTCQGCGLANYCSAACHDQALRSYHKSLCHPKQANHPLDLLRETWKQTHYPPETFNVMAIAKLAAMFRTAEGRDREQLSQALTRFQSGFANINEGIVHKMLGPNYEVFSLGEFLNSSSEI
jgi:SET and MYND domain-containing protein 5